MDGCRKDAALSGRVLQPVPGTGIAPRIGRARNADEVVSTTANKTSKNDAKIKHGWDLAQVVDDDLIGGIKKPRGEKRQTSRIETNSKTVSLRPP